MKKKENTREMILKICQGGLLSALMMAFSFAESLFPPLPFLPAGVKIGIANIIVMASLLLMGKGCAFILNFEKGLFVLLLRGPTAGFLSLAGGMTSLAAMLVFKKIKGLSQVYLSIAGGIFHNLGQIFAAYLILENPYLVYYIPVLIISGIAAGFVTGTVLKVVMPYLAEAKRHFK